MFIPVSVCDVFVMYWHLLWGNDIGVRNIRRGK